METDRQLREEIEQLEAHAELTRANVELDEVKSEASRLAADKAELEKVIEQLVGVGTAIHVVLALANARALVLEEQERHARLRTDYGQTEARAWNRVKGDG